MMQYTLYEFIKNINYCALRLLALLDKSPTVTNRLAQ
ncbi:hypothetical protein C3B55_00172 [Candidatus Pseudomonas adelgestsugas]|uniref:Transcriptional regulator n=1 Tax=Candidatus Pseudomonas adelgestsugas TaxID=1302376 RepID=A0ABX5R879_9PSED|nr:hypothetical protein C3B55_00172 [Candidatus Pseudomonas adelgestsugas]